MGIQQSDADLAKQIQQNLLPKTFPLDGYDIAAEMHPLSSAGGDYFDFIPMSDGSLGIVMGDVAGHSVGPALLMATARAYLRVLAKMHSDIGQVVTLLNRMLCEDTDRMVTLFFARLDPQTRTLSYVDAGHGHCWLLRSSGELKCLDDSDASGLPLCVAPDMEYSVSSPMALEPGDILFLATDGLTECPVADGSLFGFRPVIELVRVHRNRRARDIIGILFAAAHFILLRQGYEQTLNPRDVISMDGFHRVLEKYTDIRMEPDDMTAVLIKVV
jgi:sigma-B regulation protein RsbU (phosphoserine phosphatase)